MDFEQQDMQLERWLNLDKEQFNIFKGKTILDVGCGRGINADVVLKYGAKYVLAIDGYKDTVEFAKRNLEYHKEKVKVQFLDIEVQDLDEKFDVVLCIGVLHHLKNQREILIKLLNALQEDGKLFIWIYGKYNHIFIINCIDYLRFIASRLPMPITKLLADIITPFVYLLIKLLHGKYFKLLRKFSYGHIKTIVLDQILPTIAKYYTEEDVKELIDGLNLKYEKDRNEVGWVITNG